MFAQVARRQPIRETERGSDYKLQKSLKKRGEKGLRANKKKTYGNCLIPSVQIKQSQEGI